MDIVNRRWLVLGGAFAAGLVIGVGALFILSYQSSKAIGSGSAWYSYIAGQRLVAPLSAFELATSPKWMPNASLPLRPEDAIVRAHQSLAMLGPAVADWPFSELALHEDAPHGFFYTVTFRPIPPALHTEWVQLLVYLNGNVTVPTKDGHAP